MPPDNNPPLIMDPPWVRTLALAQAAPRCERCNRPARRGQRFCQVHGPGGLRNPDALALVRAIKAGLIPADVRAHPVWRQANERRCAKHRLAVLAAWVERDAAPLALVTA